MFHFRCVALPCNTNSTDSCRALPPLSSGMQIRIFYSAAR